MFVMIARSIRSMVARVKLETKYVKEEIRFHSEQAMWKAQDALAPVLTRAQFEAKMAYYNGRFMFRCVRASIARMCTSVVSTVKGWFSGPKQLAFDFSK